MRKKYVAGNWKMNGDREEALSLATEIKGMLTDEYRGNAGVILAPPFVHIDSVVKLVGNSGIGVAAQNCSSEPSGAFTGEVAASMIRSVGAAYVIVGHSERRSYFNESDSELAAKVNLALQNELAVIFCVGESLAQRNAFQQEVVVKAQLEQGLFHLSNLDPSKLMIAYEPVWAIGTGITATPEQAQEMHAYIRMLLAARYGHGTSSEISILYGGSCNESNASVLFSLPDVDGGLIGGASLKSRSFVNIVKCI